jgi:hypothetical protein
MVKTVTAKSVAISRCTPAQLTDSRTEIHPGRHPLRRPGLNDQT